MTDYVVVAIFQFQAELAVLKTKLAFENIDFITQDENIVSIDPFASIAYGGIKLKIHQKDLDRAKKIIEDFQLPLRKI